MFAGYPHLSSPVTATFFVFGLVVPVPASFGNCKRRKSAETLFYLHLQV
jgi:hypothetical protein